MGIVKDEYRVGPGVTPSPTPSGATPAVAPRTESPYYTPLQTNLPKRNQDGDEGFLYSLIKPTVKFVESEQERLKKLYGGKSLKERLAISFRPEEIIRRVPVAGGFIKPKEEGGVEFDVEGAKAAANVASFLLPAGKAGLAGKTLLTAGSGFLQGISEEKATPASVATSTALGAAFGPVLHYGGKIIKPVLQKGLSLATKIFPKTAEELGLSAATKAAREAITAKGFAEIPKEINLAFYRQIPISFRKILGIAGKEVRKKLLAGKTIPTPPALITKIKQIQAGGSTTGKKLMQFALRPAEEAVEEAPKGFVAGVKAGLERVRTGIDEAAKNLAFQSSKVIARQGTYGRLLSKLMRDTRDISERRAGGAIADIENLLQNFSEKENASLVKFLDEGVKPANQKVTQVGLTIRSMLDNVADEAAKLGIKQTELRGMGMTKKGFTKLENYFPHIFTNTDQFNQAQVREKILQRLISSGKAADRADAIKLLDKFIKKTSPRRFGSLEFGRVVDLPGWESNPKKALSVYFDRAFRRLEEVKRFGPNNERVFGGVINGRKIMGITQRIAEEGGDVDFVEKAFKRVHGTEIPTLTTQRFKEQVLRGAGSAQVITKMGLGQITNLGQTFNTIVKAGIGPTWKAIKMARTKEGREFALRSGAILDSVLRDALEQSGGSTGSKFLKWTGFSSIEEMNRVISAYAGKELAQDTIAKQIQGKANPAAIRVLEKMGINVEKVVKRGNLNQTELLKAGQKMSEWTQFRVGAIDVPYVWSTPEGRLVTQFKNFAFKHAQFMKESVIDEAIKYHNFGPLRRLIIFSQLIGEPLADIKALVRGKDPLRREDFKSIPQRMWDNYATLGSFGIFYDMIQSAQYGRTSEFITGPTIGDITAFAESGYQAGKGKPKPLVREIVRRVPIVGPILKSLIPSENKKKSGTKLQPLAPLKPR